MKDRERKIEENILKEITSETFKNMLVKCEDAEKEKQKMGIRATGLVFLGDYSRED